MPYKARIVEGAALLALAALGLPAVAQDLPATGSKPPSAFIDYSMATQCAASGGALATISASDAAAAAKYSSFGAAYRSWAQTRAQEKGSTAVRATQDIDVMLSERLRSYENAKAKEKDGGAKLLKSYQDNFAICLTMGRKRD